ncbi:hypothetical protein ACHAWF_008363 [Thalassiosira exigua]
MASGGGNSLLELKARYDDFLREDRFGYPERIGTAVDDCVRRSSGGGGGGGGKAGGGGIGGSNDASGGSLTGRPRLRVPLSDLRSFDPRLSNALRRDPLRHVRALESAAHDLAGEERPGYDKDDSADPSAAGSGSATNGRIKVALGGPVGSRALNPRELGSSHLRRLVCLEGVAVKVSGAKPKVCASVHYCPSTRQHESRSYVDATDPELGLPQVDDEGRELPDKVVQLTGSSYPTKDREGNALETEYGLSSYKDHQTATLQEMPERAPMGQLPRSVELVLDHDLVDKVRRGGRMRGRRGVRGRRGGSRREEAAVRRLPWAPKTLAAAQTRPVLNAAGAEAALVSRLVDACEALSDEGSRARSIGMDLGTHPPRLGFRLGLRIGFGGRAEVKPGDRVQIVGVYRALSSAAQGQRSTSGVFPTVVLVNDIRVLGRDSHGLVFTPADVRAIRSLAQRPDVLDVLGRSVCPSIHGHGVIKKALALQLLGGCEKNLANGTHLRGDVNVLLVGDPSTAKSQLLRSAMQIAPLAVSTTGKGSSGVGLTAAVTSDPETGERRLEAGAMVLADRGLVCVDEFDKMGEGDRVAIHEAMEQQTVTIAKAGLHASLNARCSVLAAANPVYGQYDRRRRVQENIGLPDSLLSRFDLLFVVLDQMDPENDRRIAAHVVRGHKYRNAQGRAGHDSDYDDDDDETSDEEADEENGAAGGGGDANKAHSIWARSRYDSSNPSGAPSSGEDDDPHSDDVLQHEFLRKYLHFAKTRMRPVLTEGARECIAGRYAEMRGRQDERTLPVTARSLETIIRLASAHAKARLSAVVEADPDVGAAMDILGFALYHENTQVVGEEDAKAAAAEAALGQKRQREEPDLTDSSADEEEQEARRRRVAEEGAEDEAAGGGARADSSGDDALAKLKAAVWQVVSTSIEDSVAVDDVCVDVDDRALVQRAIQSLEEDGRIMQSEGEVYLID